MNSFGEIFKISLFGASHDDEIGIKINGCPKDIALSVDDFLPVLQRRKPGQFGTTARIEDDLPQIISGLENGLTTGEEIKISFANKNIQPKDYNFGGFYRPGHADFVSAVKYGEVKTGGGFFSGRTTVALVAAGVVASKLIPEIKIEAELIEVGGSENINQAIEKASQQGDSLGGKICCNIFGLPVGWGEPYFNSLESVISHAMFSIPGIKAISFGEGIASASMKGSEFNDRYSGENGQTFTNNSGGINGGISNGNTIYFDLFVRPTSSISKPQITYNHISKKTAEFIIKGRHDVCFALRLPVVVEMLVACVLCDFKLIFEKHYSK